MKFFLSFLIFAITLSTYKANDFDYKYQSKWYDLYNECSYNRQSPIELSSIEAINTTDMPALKFKNYDVPYNKPVELSNNGHTANIQLPKPSGYVDRLWKKYDKLLPSISGGPLLNGWFVAEAVHFHWGSKDAHGSEHVIDSERYSMEMHIVHRNSKYQTVDEAKLHSDGLAVLAVFYNVKPTQITSFKGLDYIIELLPSIKEFNDVSEIANFKLIDLFGDMDVTEFYTYDGSLTTPPCSQAVTWIVFPQVINISHLQMAKFRLLSDAHGEVLENNYRHLQSKNARQIYHRQNSIDSKVKSKFLDTVAKLKPLPLNNDNLLKLNIL